MSFKWGFVENAYSSDRLNDNSALTVSVHMAGLGDGVRREKEWVGTKGQSRRLEGFSVKRLSPTDSFKIKYSAHLAGPGDVGEVNEGEFIGTKGQHRRLEGFSIWLADQQGPLYNVYYQAHLEGPGDTEIYKNG
jgi:hypothetical protein